MGLDMWFLKMKDNKKWDLDTGCWAWDKYNRSPEEGECDNVCPDKCCWWNDSGKDIDDYLSKDNYYYDRGFENADLEWNIIKIVEKEMGVELDFEGYPISSPDEFNKFYDWFEKWVKEKWDNRTVFDNPDEYYCVGEETFKFDRMLDFLEYVRVAKENGFTMWFSR